jgi:sugar (pentulose or hexulose) kinase
MKTPTIAIFDIGKTNKKLFLFNENYEIVYEKSMQFDETTDEDGDPCEDVELLSKWVIDTFDEVLQNPDFDIKALNFSTYGASFVHLDSEGKVIAPLYNYLKPYSETLKKQFYDTYGGEQVFTRKTASPVLGNLNSGMVLYRLKYENPVLFDQIYYSLHLPQYISFLFTGQYFSDITSIGCHTNLWNFEENQYHEWVEKEGAKLAPLTPRGGVFERETYLNSMSEVPPLGVRGLLVGFGLHDSSAALIPYLATFKGQKFVLISTGTWCITLNPFNHTPLTDEELLQDCLIYMQYTGDPVKASRLFAGYEHEQIIKQLSEQFQKPLDYYKTVKFNPKYIEIFKDDEYESTYHQLILNLVNKQIVSTKLVLNDSTVTKLFVDGGFGKNEIYMNLLAKAFPEMEVYAASVAQATALGAALAIHEDWNMNETPQNLIDLKRY